MEANLKHHDEMSEVELSLQVQPQADVLLTCRGNPPSVSKHESNCSQTFDDEITTVHCHRINSTCHNNNLPDKNMFYTQICKKGTFSVLMKI